MLPRYHILSGIILTVAIWFFFPKTPLFFLGLFLFSSFLMDFDHYVVAAIKNNDLSLFKAFNYHKVQGEIQKQQHRKGIFSKGDFHILHTIEFHTFIFLLGFAWKGFFFIFAGMLLHSLLDTIYLFSMQGSLYQREFSLGNWIAKKACSKIK
jgi:hypothetical protein